MKGIEEMKVIVTLDIGKQNQKKLIRSFPDGEFSFTENIHDLPSQLLEEADVLVNFGEEGALTDEILKAMPRLKWVHVMQAGVENMPHQSLIERNIPVTNVKGIHTVPMSEYAISVMLQIVRKGYVFYDAQKRKQWDHTTTVDVLSGKTVGILGLGAIGSEIAKKAKCFGMRVIALKRNPAPKQSEVDEIILLDQKERIFRESDFLIVLLPHTTETNHFVDADELALMKPTAHLINMGRGQVINEEALIESLQNERIAGAVLDVFSEEPLPETHPFWEMENVTITPHVSGDRYPTYMEQAVDILMQNLQRFSKNEPLVNVVDLTSGY